MADYKITRQQQAQLQQQIRLLNGNITSLDNRRQQFNNNLIVELIGPIDDIIDNLAECNNREALVNAVRESFNSVDSQAIINVIGSITNVTTRNYTQEEKDEIKRKLRIFFDSKSYRLFKNGPGGPPAAGVGGWKYISKKRTRKFKKTKKRKSRTRR